MDWSNRKGAAVSLLAGALSLLIRPEWARYVASLFFLLALVLLAYDPLKRRRDARRQAVLEADAAQVEREQQERERQEKEAARARAIAEREAEITRLEKSEPPWAAFIETMGKLEFYDLARQDALTDAEWTAWREVLDESRGRAEEIEERLRPTARQFVEGLAVVPRESIGSGLQAYDNFQNWLMTANASYVEARRRVGLPVPDRSRRRT